MSNKEKAEATYKALQARKSAKQYKHTDDYFTYVRGAIKRCAGGRNK